MPTSVDYSITDLQAEARQLVSRGKINPHQPIYVLCQFIPPREWICVECELEQNDYLLRDHICDLLAKEEWSND